MQPEPVAGPYLDRDHYDRMRDAIAEARLGVIDPYPPLHEDLPDDWTFDDD